MVVRDYKVIRLAINNFWHGFSLSNFIAYFPFLKDKYRFVEDPQQPDFVIRSSFVRDGEAMLTIRSMAELPEETRAPTLFFTGENVAPDLLRCDYAISFCRDLDDPRHIRVPLWVPRLYEIGWQPSDLLSRNFTRHHEQPRFCNFVFSNPVAERERLFRLVSTRQRVDAPSQSMQNMPRLGPGFWDKYRFMRDYRFSIAAENVRSDGYCTEKIMEAFLAGGIPVYAGDPGVATEFNPEAFLEVDASGGYERLSDAVLRTNADAGRRRRMASEPIYPDDRLPESASQERIMAFFESVFG